MGRFDTKHLLLLYFKKGLYVHDFLQQSWSGRIVRQEFPDDLYLSFLVDDGVDEWIFVSGVCNTSLICWFRYIVSRLFTTVLVLEYTVQIGPYIYPICVVNFCIVRFDLFFFSGLVDNRSSLSRTYIVVFVLVSFRNLFLNDMFTFCFFLSVEIRI